MLQIAEDMKNGGWYKKYTMYIYAIIAVLPQVMPLISDLYLPVWFKSTISMIAVLGIIARTVKQNGFKPALS